MKLKKSDISLLIAAVGVIIAVATYFLVYTKCNEKTDQLNAANAQLQTEVDYLQNLADNKQQYIDDTAAMQADIDEIIAKFPASYKPEDEILYTKDLEDNYDVTIANVSFGGYNPIEVAAVTAETVSVEGEAAPAEGEAAPAEGEAAPAEAVAPQKTLYSSPVSVSIVTSYNSIKDIITKITTDQDRKSIESLSLAFDSESGDLTGAMQFTMYSMTGTDKQYTSPDVSGVNFGTGNIFNSADKKSAIQAEKAAEKAAEEAENSAE